MLTNNIEPILLHAGPIIIRWYGLFLAIGVIVAILIYTKLFKEKGYNVDLLYDLSIWMVIGGLIGARLGHVFFYNWAYFSQNLSEIIFINHGGLSSHGMTIGLLLTLFLYTKIKKVDLKKYLDILVIPIPLLAAFIRLGNFFNSEIIGKPTMLPWGVWFERIDPPLPSDPFIGSITRHPTQIYESLNALGIFIILYTVYRKKIFNAQYAVCNLFIFLYFSTRFLIEFVKERQGIDNLWVLSMGQLLSIPFVAYSIWWFLRQKINTKK